MDFSLIDYNAVLKYSELWFFYVNSIFYTGVGICISIVVTLAAAYTLSRRDFPGKAVLSLYFVVTMFFSGGLIPTFLVMRDLHLYNTWCVMILMGCVSVWNLMVARTYIQNSIPKELYEAAMLAVYYGMAKWNDYFTGLVYLRNRALLSLQTVLREILAALQVDMTGDCMMTMADSAASMQEAMRIVNVSKYCIIVVATGPVVILDAMMQKYFEKDVMIVSLKG